MNDVGTGATRAVAGSQAVRRWKALVALTIFVGTVGGLSIALLAGASRSSSVVERFFATARTYDALVYAPIATPDMTAARLRAVPGVKRADPGTYVAFTGRPRGGGEPEAINSNAVDWTARDPTMRIVAGHVPDGSDPSEVVVNEAFLRQFGAAVGDTIDARAFGVDQGDQVGQGVYQPDGPSYRFRIGGVVRMPQDIATDEASAPGANQHYSARSAMFLSNDWYEAHRDEFLGFGAAFQARLRDGRRGMQAFADAVPQAWGTTADQVQVFEAPRTFQRPSLEATVQLESTVLLVLGIGLALVGAIAATLLLRTEQRSCSDDAEPLRAMGMTGRQLGWSAAWRCAPVAVGGAVVAAAVGIALSGRFPIGVGRQVELTPGVDVNATIVGLGAAAIAMLCFAAAFVFGRERVGRTRAPARPPMLANWLNRSSAPTNVTIAANLAFGPGQHSKSAPSRAAVVGGGLVLAVIVGVGVYVSGVDHLYGDAHARGWEWDAIIGNTNFPLADRTASRVGTDPRIAAHTTARYDSASVDGHLTDLVAFDPQGGAPPAVVAGRLPLTTTEIALGAKTMRDLGVHLGSTVELASPNDDSEGDAPATGHPMKVVGQSLFPTLGDDDIGTIGYVTLDGAAAAGGDATPQLELVRLHGTDRAATLRSIDGDYTEEIATDIVPAHVVGLHRVRDVPLLGIAIAAVMGTFVLVYVLSVNVRRRTHELAMLRALGLPARRIGWVVGWQGILLAIGMVVVGVPTGLLAGATLWRHVADDLGVYPDVNLARAFLLVVPFVLVVAVAASWVPSRRSRRATIASLLRVE